MDYREITYTDREPLGIVTLNRPEKINALSRRMVAELSHLFDALAGAETVKALIVQAAGKHFCAGHDLSEMVGVGAAEAKAIFDDCTAMMQKIHRLPQPVIAQVQGVATAAGCQLAAWCDLTVAESGARFATPGVRIGLFCTTPMVAISRAIGRKAAMEMLLTGRYYSAHEAKELGLVNRVVPPEELAAATQALAMEIAEASRFVLALGKRAFYEQIDRDDDGAFDFARHTISLNLLAEDAQHGIRAFIEKKTPEWKNR